MSTRPSSNGLIATDQRDTSSEGEEIGIFSPLG